MDVSSLFPISILCNKKAKMKGGVTLSTNRTLTVTFQMYIGSEPPEINDWTTIVSEQVASNSPYIYHFNLNMSDINPSLTTNGYLYFRMIHGEEHSDYTTYATVGYLQIES